MTGAPSKVARASTCAVRARLARLTAAGVVAAITLVSGCTSTPDRSPEWHDRANSVRPSSTVEATDPNRQGPPARWSLEVLAGEPWVGVFNDVAVVTVEDAIFGVDRSSGKELWRHALPDKVSVRVASELIVITKRAASIEVIAPSTGATVWKTGTTDKNIEVYQKAVYTDSCVGRKNDRPGACKITAYDVRDGRTRWTAPSAISGVSFNQIGPRGVRALAQDSGRYLVAGVGAPGRRYAVIDAATGRALAGRARGLPWAIFAVGTLVVTTDNDPPLGDDRCTVSVEATDGRTGAAAWSAAVFSGRNADGTCDKSLAGRDVQDVIGSGSKIAAVTDGGKPQVFDLATGRTVWVGDDPGVPIDADDSAVLVRRLADSGEIALLDFATGKVRWSAPDPGLRGGSASWSSAVTSGLVAVSCGFGRDQTCVVVYDATTGKQLGRFPGWLAGAGSDWVAISHSSPKPTSGSLNLDFITFDR